MQPWEYHPDLSEERLVCLGLLISNARNTVLDLFDERGDDAWAVGCRAFSWCRKAIVQAAGDSDHAWLSVMDASKQFIFRIGAVPVRFFRGETDRPAARALGTADREAVQGSFSFPDESRAFQLIWRFVVETYADGDLDRIVFAGYTENGIAECKWEVPLLGASVADLQFETDNKTVDEMPEPEVFLPHVEIDDVAND